MLKGRFLRNIDEMHIYQTGGENEDEYERAACTHVKP